jgi:cell division protein ZapA
MENPPKHSIKVEIYKQTYTVRSNHDPAYIQELADYVNSRMREVEQGMMGVDSLRVAILTALQIADELHMSRKEVEDAGREIDERSTKYAELLDQILRPRPADADLNQ